MSNLSRRQFLTATAATLALGGCSTMTQESEVPTTSDSPAASAPQDAPATTTAGSFRVLIAYFSRAGENYAAGGVIPTEVGNTKVMAGYIKDALGCDEFEIVPTEAYPYSYDETLAIAQNEIDSDARPAIKDELPDLDGYDAILLGCPVWWGQPPLIVRTFLEALAERAAGKTVIPFTTHGGSGLGRLDSVIAEEWPDATVSDSSLAVSGATISEARDQVTTWANGLGLA